MYKFYFQKYLALICVFACFCSSLVAQDCLNNCTVTVTTDNQTINATNSVDVICIAADVLNTTFNNLGAGDIVCVADGVTWTMPANLNYNGLVTYIIGENANVELPGQGSTGNVVIDNSGNLTMTNTNGVTFNANGGTELNFINRSTGVVDALGIPIVLFGNGSDFTNEGTMSFNNLETAEADDPFNGPTGVINVRRTFYIHSLGFTSFGTINTTCEPTGVPAWDVLLIQQAENGCGLTIGDKGPFEAVFGPSSCSVTTGSANFNGPAMITGYMEVIGNVTIARPVIGDGTLVVTDGFSQTVRDGALLGGLTFYDTNTANGFGNTPSDMVPNGLDANNGNPTDDFVVPAVLPLNPCLDPVACIDPSVDDPADQIVCEGEMTTAVTFTGTPTTSNTLTFSYTVSGDAIGVPADAGTGMIPAFTPTGAGTATIEVTPMTNDGQVCPGLPETFTITVNPAPTVVDPADQTICEGDMTTAVTFTGTPATASFSYTVSGDAIGVPADAGTGMIAAFTPSVAGTATIEVTPQTNDGVACEGAPETFTITANPLPPCEVNGPTMVNTNAAATFTGPTGTGFSYEWTVPAGAVINGADDELTVSITFSDDEPSYIVGLTVINEFDCTRSCDLTVLANALAPVSVGDTAFVDLNGDGLQTMGEPGIGGVTIALLDSSGDTVMVDADGNMITGVVMTAPDGSYLFDNLPPGEYSVSFDISTADDAEFYAFTTPNAGDDADDSDNSIGLSDSTAQSDLTPFLNSGEADLTLDVGLVCDVEVVVAEPFTICSTQPVELNSGVTIMPDTSATFGATWTTPDGTGDFVDADGNVLASPYRFGMVARYIASPADAQRGSVTLVLTTDDPTGPCDPVSDSVTIEILEVDCGEFMWEGQ